MCCRGMLRAAVHRACRLFARGVEAIALAARLTHAGEVAAFDVGAVRLWCEWSLVGCAASCRVVQLARVAVAAVWGRHSQSDQRCSSEITW